MRILFVFGKALPYRLDFFRSLSRRFNVAFLMEYVDQKDRINTEGLIYETYRTVSIPFLGKYGSFWYGSPTIPVNLATKLINDDWDLIISKSIGTLASYISFFISRILKKPFILWDETWYFPLTLERRVTLPLTRVMVKGAKAIIVPGSKSRDFFISLGADPHKIFIAPNAGEELEKDQKIVKSLRRSLGLKEKKVVLYFGRLIERKGCQHLLEAFAKLERQIPNVHLIFAGDGPYKGNLKNMLLKLKGQNVSFLGYIEEKDKGSIYSLGSFVVIPSIKTSITAEIWGMVLNEAMSLGKPVIATDAVGGAFDMIMNGFNGFIVKERDEHELYLRIRELMTDEDLIAKMGERSQRVVKERFSLVNMMEGFIKAIKYAYLR
jgi:glycosyltransferase involved in cell wall biosynthesis